MKIIKQILNQINIFKIFYILALIFLNTNLSLAGGPAAGLVPDFKLNPDELKGLNLNEKEAQEIEKFVTSLNQMDPKELESLQKLADELTLEMKNKGLDPNNPDDIFKWIDEESQKEKTAKPQKEKKAQKEQQYEPVYTPKTTPKTELIEVGSKEDVLKVLQDIEKYLSRVRQKAQTYEESKRKLDRWHLELSKLIFYLNVLQQPDLLKHLISKDFYNLQRNLEKLRNNLANYEPEFKARKAGQGEEDPYEILGLPYTATQKEIKKAFLDLKKKIHPNVIAKQLESQGLSEKAKNRKLKEARLTFKFIQSAYDSLKDPKNKAMVDRLLEDKISQQEEIEESSQRAFNNIVNQLSNSIYQDDILTDIERLLEKYKPEELEKAKKQEELEKKVFERSKEEKKVIPSAKSFEQQQDPYEEFYRHLAQQDWQRQLQRYYPQAFAPSSSGPSTAADTTSGPEQKEDGGPKDKGGKKEGKKEDKEKKDKDKKDKGDKGEKAGPSDFGLKLKDKDVKTFTDDITKLSKLFDSVKDEIEVDELDDSEKSDATEPEEPERNINLEEEQPEGQKIKTKKVKIKFDQIINNFKDYLKTEPTEKTRSNTKLNFEDNQPIDAFNKYIKTNKIVDESAKGNDVWTYLSKLENIEKHEFNLKIRDAWKKLYDKHSNKIKTWYEQISKLSKMKDIDPNKKTLFYDFGSDKFNSIKDNYNIDLLNVMKFHETQKNIKEIYDWFNGISKKLIGENLEKKEPKI